ncbi:MAG: hypothetical protein RIC16_16645 [Rhodospirillales bacterium]
MTERYIFTVATGRCGQSSLTHLLNTHVEGCYAAFEEPSPKLRFKGALRDLERHFRRRFIETHELLGRGKVLTAFENGDEAYLDRIAAKRLRLIDAKGARIHVDVSKYFARGLHKSFARACPGMGLILLVRDPVLNMRSFLNRNKRFTLDNNMPDARSNLLRMSHDDFEKGEFYLWAWCEMYLRYLALLDEFDIGARAIIRTEDLNDAERMNAHFDDLALEHSPVVTVAPRNTNEQQGKGATAAASADVDLFLRFRERLPADMRQRIGYLADYDPRKHLT